MTRQEVIAAVNEALLKAKDDRACKDEPINWADLRCVEAKEFKDGSWFVLVEEADPSSENLIQFITVFLATWGGVRADVRCDW